jgi:hypothetical protein
MKWPTLVFGLHICSFRPSPGHQVIEMDHGPQCRLRIASRKACFHHFTGGGEPIGNSCGKGRGIRHRF